MLKNILGLLFYILVIKQKLKLHPEVTICCRRSPRLSRKMLVLSLQLFLGFSQNLRHNERSKTSIITKRRMVRTGKQWQG